MTTATMGSKSHSIARLYGSGRREGHSALDGERLYKEERRCKQSPATAPLGVSRVLQGVSPGIP